MKNDRVQGISLPFDDCQQIVAQYTQNMSVTLFDDKEKVLHLLYILKTFYLATDLVLNWLKSSGYWKQKD